MITISQFIANKNSFRHHAILLLSNYFASNTLPDKDFKQIIQQFCGISLYENAEASPYEIAAQHPDIFIVDRERKILRLEDIKKIRTLSSYPPQQAEKRLFFIENCERLNANATNSLLKVLEEPATASLFLLTSSKLSLVLPTISSRVQKVALTFPEKKQTNIKEIFSTDDLMWMKNKIEHFHLHRAKNKTPMVAEVISQCEKLAKEYAVEDLRAVIVILVNEKLKQDANFINTAKLFLAHLSDWKNHENYHPSTSLWLIRLFLLFS